MIKDGKVYRNLESQVAYLTEYLEGNAIAAELGIKVVGEAENVSDIPEGEYDYGDAYMIGTEAPYELYIWTRANGNHPEDFWFNVGHFPMPGPQGEPGIGIDDVISKMLGNWSDASAEVDGNNTTITMFGTESTTTSDNTTYTSDTTIELPFITDGQVKIDTYDEKIRVRLNETLSTTYLPQKTAYDAVNFFAYGMPIVYGNNCSSTGKINSVKTVPFVLGTATNLLMYPHLRGNTYDVANNNTVASNDSQWNTALGKGNSLQGSDSYNANTENLVFGGKNILYDGVQDSATFGYRNNIYANQAFTAGYKNTNKGSESIVIGSQNTLNGTITIDNTPDPDTGGYDGASSNTKQMAVFGSKNTIGVNNQTSLIAGDQNTIGGSSKWNFVVGAHQNIGSHNACVNALDYGNTTESYVEDSTMIGYGNHIYGGTSGAVVYAVNILGNNCSNRSSSTNYKKVWMIGDGLVASRDDQIILGKYNATNPYDLLQVGDGTADNARSNLFTVSNDPLDGPMLTLGTVSLTAAQITALKALI